MRELKAKEMTEIPNDVKYFLKEIEKSHDVWKAFYWGMHGRAKFMKEDPKFKDKDWDMYKIEIPLNASGEPPRPYTLCNMYEILTESDLKIIINHLLWIHLLIESLANKINKMEGIVKAKGNLNQGEILSDFLIDNGLMDRKDKKQFELSKETRNQFAHGFSSYTTKWKKLSQELKPMSYFKQDGTIHLDVKDCEKWQKIFEKIGKEVRKRYVEGEKK